MLGPERTLEVVREVLDQTGAVRTLMNIGGSIFGFLAGMLLAEHWSVTRDSRTLYLGTVTLAAVLVTLLANVAGQYYLNRRLEAAFDNA